MPILNARVSACLSCWSSLSLLLASSVHSMERDIYSLSLEELAEVVVTDTKVAQPQVSVTQKVEVLSAQTISRQPTYNRNLSELLQYQAGLFVNVLSRNDANWGSYGGLGPKYNSYLLDGLPVDSFIDGLSLSPWAVDRVELHKGPASVMYSNFLSMDFAGNETPLAGITNFILKDRIETESTRFLLGGGSWNTFDTRLYHQNHKENFHYFLGADYEQSDYTNYGTPISWLNIQEDPSYQDLKLYTKLTYLFERDDHKASLFVHHTQREGEAGRPNRDFDHAYDTVNVAYDNQVNGMVNFGLKAGYRNYDRRWAEDNFPLNFTLREQDGVEQQIYPVDLTINVKHGGSSLLTAGADSQVATYRTYSEVNGGKAIGNDVSSYSTGLFLQEKVIVNKWVLRAGGRFSSIHHSYDLLSGMSPEQTDSSWEKTLWSAGIRYNHTAQLALYANSGSSFIAPSAKAIGGTLKATDAGVLGKDGQLPNPGLTPESGIGTDLGVDFRPTERLALGLRVFVNQVDDAIVENMANAAPSQTQSVNAGQATSSGLEITLDHALGESFSWFANATLTSTTVENPLNPDQDDTDIPFVPDSVVNAGLSAKLPGAITLSPYLHWVGTYYDSTSANGRLTFGPYAVFNCTVQKKLVLTTDYALDLAIDLNNLTNQRYEMPWQFRDPGFNAFARLEVTF